MHPTIRLGRLFGIDIGLHYSWFLIALLIVFSLGTYFQVTNPDWTPQVVWTVTGLTAVLFFASILTHELSHAAVAKSRGVSVRSITLFALGGIANIEKESADAKSEFWIAIVGPATSVVLGLLFLGLAFVGGWTPENGTPRSPMWTGVAWLGYINIALAVFNMIPGYPLDGGRVLRAVAWHITGNLSRATKVAAGFGQFFATGLIVLGLLWFFSGGGFGGLWMAFVGWFLSQAAAASYTQVRVTAELSGNRVQDLMFEDFPTVDGDLDLRTFGENYLLRTGRRCFVVMRNGEQAGIVTVDDTKQIDRDRWPFTRVSQIALPVERARTVSPDAGVNRALEIMVRENVNQLPVVANGTVLGMISRANVLQLLETRSQLKAA